MEITKSNLKIFRQDFKNTVESLQKEYGVTIDMKNITYNDEDFHFTVEVTNGDKAEAERNKFIAALKRNSWKYPALNNDSYGKDITINLVTCKIVGIKSRASKYPIVAIKETDGKRYRYTYETIKNALNNKNKD
tara:strand:+ start:3198 stop:3599 length:402 start_codon:yes stop_codon:yes gene_type:complete